MNGKVIAQLYLKKESTRRGVICQRKKAANIEFDHSEARTQTSLGVKEAEL